MIFYIQLHYIMFYRICLCIVLCRIEADIYPGGGRAKPGFCLNLLDPGDTTPRRQGHYFTIFNQIRDKLYQSKHYHFQNAVVSMMVQKHFPLQRAGL